MMRRARSPPRRVRTASIAGPEQPPSTATTRSTGSISTPPMGRRRSATTPRATSPRTGPTRSAIERALLRRRRVLPPEQGFAELEDERVDEGGDVVEAGAGLSQALVEVEAAVDLELEGVDSARRPGVALDHMAARGGVSLTQWRRGQSRCLGAIALRPISPVRPYRPHRPRRGSPEHMARSCAARRGELPVMS